MKKVLLTDDNDDMIELVKLVLADSGYKVLVASNGEDAVKLCLDENPDLVLMDLKMPMLDGFSATRKLRSSGCQNPVIMLTGSEKQEHRDRAREAGCNDYILKTMDMAEVKTTLERYLGEAGDGLNA